MKKRMGIVDIWRIVGCLCLISYHLPTLDSSFIGQNYPFAMGWIFVEFFFFITGYFTYQHFCKIKWVDGDEAGKNALVYTVQKFGTYMPYIVISYMLQISMNIAGGGIKNNLRVSIIPEILLLSRGDGILPLLWFLSAMFIVFPLFCYLCQIKQRHLVYAFAIPVVIIIYDRYLTVLGVRMPLHLIRATAGLLTGVLVWYVSSLISQIEFTSLERFFITIIEEGALLWAVFMIYNNSNTISVILLLFFTGLCLIFSKKSWSSFIGGAVTDLIGQLSILMFLCQDPVASFINLYIPIVNLTLKVAMFFLLDAMLSLLIYIIVRELRKRVHFVRIKQIKF